jgi:hypothetical protein
MVSHLARTFVGPTVERIHYALKVLLDHRLPKRTVAERDLEDTANVVPEALIFPEFC